jgi:hypothetical protein
MFPRLFFWRNDISFYIHLWVTNNVKFHNITKLKNRDKLNFASEDIRAAVIIAFYKCVIHQTSTAMQVKSLLFPVCTQRTFVDVKRRFGRVYQFHCQQSSNLLLLDKTVCPLNCQHKLRTNARERGSHLPSLSTIFLRQRQIEKRKFIIT